MTPLVWANFPLALLFLLAWAGHPLRMTLRHPGTVPDRARRPRLPGRQGGTRHRRRAGNRLPPQP
jgi:hypothetical protein